MASNKKKKIILVLFMFLCACTDKNTLAQETDETADEEKTTQNMLSNIPENNKPTLPTFHLLKNATIEGDEEYDEDDDDEDTGPILLSQFVRRFDTSSYVPPDFEKMAAELEDASSLAATSGGHLASILASKFKHINDTLNLVDRLQAYGNQLLTGSKDLKDTALYIGSLLSDRMTEAKLDSQCTADIANIARALQERELWAIKLLDAWAHIPSGLMSGVMSSFGEFEQCIGIRSGVQNEDSGRRIYGKYCPVQMRLPTPKLDQFNPSFEAILNADPRVKMVKEMALKFQPEDIQLKDVKAEPRLFMGFKLAQAMSELGEVMRGAVGFYGTCFPASCSAKDIEQLFNFIFYPVTGIPLQVEEEWCTVHEEVRKPVQLDRFQRLAVIVFATAITIVGTCTVFHALLILVDKVQQSKKKVEDNKVIKNDGNNNIADDNQTVTNGTTNNTININIPEKPCIQIEKTNTKSSCADFSRQLLHTFSAISNSKTLFTFNNRHAVLDTIRFILTVVIFSIQSLGFLMGMSAQTLRDQIHSLPGEVPGQARYWWFRSPGIWNDGFVFTFGVTLVFQQFNRLSKVGVSFNYFAYVFRRWFRLSLSLLGILMAIYLFPLAGDGPYWHNVENQFVDSCRYGPHIRSLFGFYGNWNVYLNDYKVGHYFPICCFPTWFISMSTQLYLFAPLFFLSMFFYPTCGVIFTVFVLLISPLFTLLPRLMTGFYSYAEPTKFTSISDIYAAILHYHMNPALYITSLMIGMLTGYLIKRKPNMRLPGGWFGERILWLSSFLGTVGIFLWFNSFFGDYRTETTGTEAMAWWILSKFVFSGFLGVTCYLCCTGRGGIINQALTVRALQPIAKLSFGIYLLRSLTIYYRIGTVRFTYPIYFWQHWQNLIFDYFITAFLSYFLHILFDGPALGLIRIAETFNFDKLLNRPNAACNLKTNQESIPSPPSLVIQRKVE